ncbi:MAG: D-glycerate dehydrogenase [Rhodocyclaceae bacterium]|nr:D-glycerate dehydrogenase [Rhodocyclaceae bacterium]
MNDASARRVLVTRRTFDEVLAGLRLRFDVDDNQGDQPLTPDELAARAAPCEGIVAAVADAVTPALLDACPRLRVVANCAVGTNNVDIPACTARGVMVTNTPGVLDDTTADHAWALMFAAARRVVSADRWLRDGHWRAWGFMDWHGVDVHHATLGIVGMGRIGRAIARRAAGFDMRVIYHNRKPLPDDQALACGAGYAGLDELLSSADFVVVSVPYGPATHHLIGARELALLKPSAVFVNIARGGVVDDAALVEVLQEGRIAAAGIDVFENEPKLHPGFPALDNAVLTPHIASASRATRLGMAELAARNLVAALEGARPPSLVNPEVLSRAG